MNRSHWSIINSQPINFRSINPYDQTRRVLLAQKKHRRYNSQPNMSKQKTQQQRKSKLDFGYSPKQSLQTAKYFCHNIQNQCFAHKKLKSQQFTYNKWYIKPQFRLRKREQLKIQMTQPEYSYQNLYSQKVRVQNDTLKLSKNKRVEFAQNFAFKQNGSVSLLSQFKKRSQKQKKRVPKLVDLIVEFHNRKRKINNLFDERYR